MVIPDTSVWVDFSRRGARGPAARLAALLDHGEVATCGPIAAELLAGAGGQLGERIWEALASLPWASLNPPAWRQVGELAAALRRSGQPLPLTDLAIAVAAARAGHALWSFDADFVQIAAFLDTLQLFDPDPASGA